MQAYRTETIERDGATYKVEWQFDEYHGAPWKECDGHGPVSDWESRAKRPNELVLAQDGRYRLFYDFAAAVKLARRDGWHMAKTGAQAVEAARKDFNYLRRWCNNDWHYCGISVTLLDDDGEETGISAALGGIEDEGRASQDWHDEVIRELIAECNYQRDAKTYPVTACGV